MSLLVTYLVSLTVHLASSSKICTDLQNYHFVERNVRLPNVHVISLSTQGQVLCARTCLARRWCKSFNFNINSGKCELNYLTLFPGGLNTTHLVPAAGFVFSDIKHWPEVVAGACANHNCTINTYCDPVDTHKYLCQKYANPTSCAEAKECDPSSTDGEYWLRIPHFGLYRTRIYCHNMNTSNPVEYMTLPSPNYGIYPAVANQNCAGETPLRYSCVGSGGEWWYMKIRIDIEDMGGCTN
ncbi:uncharacterized protein LOC124265302 [Haliotis rubra]|uniref:uncharacterized protein LOC124265302 n=1 Tax=Haliotis rubra TaxID=36100 RepID=UPI001EE5F7EC|nr:uncharacterized protein LOC124265302 [Haliotis rubra]